MENLLLEIKTRYDFETICQLNRFYLFRGKNYNVKACLFWCLSIVFLIITPILGILFEDILLLVLSCVFAVLVFLMFFLYFINPKIVYKKSKSMLPDCIIYRFYEKNLQIEAKGSNASGTETLNYNIIKKVYEINTAFYMVMQNNITYIIRKQDLDITQTHTLRAFLQKKYGKNYKMCL